MDWKEALLAQSQQMGIAPDASTTENIPTPTAPEQQYDATRHPALHIVMERKGRAGKTATIIEGFIWPDSEVRNVAAQLKHRLGVGGSARGGEILLQGDLRTQARDALLSLGFKSVKL